MAQLKMEPPAANPRDVVVTALKKGLDGGVSGAAAMTIQVTFCPLWIPFGKHFCFCLSEIVRLQCTLTAKQSASMFLKT